ncbi:MAG: glycosyltransferase family 4 protein [Longimicrobiales bacterium]|nr:glycosyltransferase family 4 protein [Longimicrobiales bacterium]
MHPETVLLVHNRYLERGGEDAVFEAEGRLLERFGHRVLRYERDNREIASAGALGTALRALWSHADHRAVGDLVRRERVAVAHFHNTFPLISPAAHHAARGAGAAVVQTLHNFRLLCPNAQFLRDARPCESCLGKAVPWPGVVHRCYRKSAAASSVVAGTISLHRALRTWHTQVDAFVALSRFARDRFVAGGLPADRITVGGGWMEDDVAPPSGVPGDHLLYVGRLSEEKGVRVLLEGWRRFTGPQGLRIIGDGPLGAEVEEAARRDAQITWLGRRTRGEVLDAMRRAYALVFPSICYENAPGVLAEARAAGLPVVASRLGSAAEIVTGSGSGVLFDAGDPAALARAVTDLLGDGARRASLSANARRSYEAELTPERAYERLRAIHGLALARRQATGQATRGIAAATEPE